MELVKRIEAIESVIQQMHRQSQGENCPCDVCSIPQVQEYSDQLDDAVATKVKEMTYVPLENSGEAPRPLNKCKRCHQTTQNTDGYCCTLCRSSHTTSCICETCHRPFLPPNTTTSVPNRFCSSDCYYMSADGKTNIHYDEWFNANMSK